MKNNLGTSTKTIVRLDIGCYRLEFRHAAGHSAWPPIFGFDNWPEKYRRPYVYFFTYVIEWKRR